MADRQRSLVSLRRDTPRSRGPAWHTPFRIGGQVVFFLVMTLVLAVSLGLGVGGAMSANEEVIWGTFYQRDCEPKPRGGCRSVGTWVSDDGSIRKTGIYLDGWLAPDGTVRAGYRPSGFNNDDENNIVHVEATAYGWIWFPWLLTVYVIGVIIYYAAKWWPGLFIRLRR